MDRQINDMNVLDFGRLISMISIDTPISNEFDKNYGQKKKRAFDSSDYWGNM